MPHHTRRFFPQSPGISQIWSTQWQTLSKTPAASSPLSGFRQGLGIALESVPKVSEEARKSLRRCFVWLWGARDALPSPHSQCLQKLAPSPKNATSKIPSLTPQKPGKARSYYQALRQYVPSSARLLLASIILHGTFAQASDVSTCQHTLAAEPRGTESSQRQSAISQRPASSPTSTLPADPELLEKLALASDPDFEEALDMTMPLRPEEIWRARQMHEAVENAQAAQPAKMCLESRNLSLLPQGVPQIVRLTHGYSSTLVFQDLTGKPWPILHTVLGNPKAFSALQPAQEDKPAGSRERETEHKEHTHAHLRPNDAQALSSSTASQSHILNLVPLAPRANSNLAIALEDAPYPVIVQLICDSPKSPKRSQDALIVFRLNQKGPLSKEDSHHQEASALSDLCLSLIHNTPPAEAKLLSTSPHLPGTSLWRHGQSLYLRTPHALVWPAWKSVTNGEAIRVYELGQSPSLVVAIDGKNTTVTIQESGYD